MLHAQPAPDAVVGVRPEGKLSVTVTVVPLVGIPPLFVTVKVKVPVEPRTRVEALVVFVIVRSVAVVVFSETEPVAAVESPPPLTEAVFVSGVDAFEATLAATVMAG